MSNTFVVYLLNISMFFILENIAFSETISTSPTLPRRRKGPSKQLATKKVESPNPTLPPTKVTTIKPQSDPTFSPETRKIKNDNKAPSELKANGLVAGNIPHEQLDISDLVTNLEGTERPPGNPKLAVREPSGNATKQAKPGLKALIDSVAEEVAHDVLGTSARHGAIHPTSPHSAQVSSPTNRASDRAPDLGPESLLSEEMKDSLESNSSPERISLLAPTQSASRVRVKSRGHKQVPEEPGLQELKLLQAFKKHWRKKMAAAAKKKIDIPSSGIGKNCTCPASGVIMYHNYDRRTRGIGAHF